MRHTCVAMHLILALSVIILHHVDSYSCRSIIKKLDDIKLKSVEDSTESFEVRNDEIVEMLHPFMKTGQARSRKYQPLHNNLAKLTLEPYLDGNQTHHWQINPYSRFNKRKSIGPLAIILTHLPELKKKKSETNNLYSSSSLTKKKTQYQPIKTNIQKLPEEIVKVKTDTGEEIVSNTEKSKQISFETNLNNNVITLKAGTSEVPTDVLTKSQDFVLTDDQRSNDLDNKEMHVNYNKGQKQIKLKTGQNMDKNHSTNTIQNIKMLKTVESNRDESEVEDYSVDSAYISDKDRSNNADDKTHDDNILFSAVDLNSIGPKTELGEELDVKHEDIVIMGRDTTKDSFENDPNKLKAENIGEENGQLISNTRNADQVISETKEPQSTEDVKESSLTYFQIPLDSLEQYTDLGSREGTGKKEGISVARQDHSHNYEDHTVSELDEKLREEYLTENSNGNQYRSLYKADDSYKKDKGNIEEPFEQNALISSLNYIIDRQEQTDKEMNSENPTEDSVEIKEEKKNSYTSEVTNKGPKYWYQDNGDLHHYHPQNIYNLCFHFKR